MGVGGQRHVLAVFTPGKDPVPIVQEAGWAPGPVWTDVENLAPTGIGSLDCPARSKSLYQLCYPSTLLHPQGPTKLCEHVLMYMGGSKHFWNPVTLKWLWLLLKQGSQILHGCDNVLSVQNDGRGSDMSVCHSWPWSRSVLLVLTSMSQSEEQENVNFFCKLGKSKLETPESLKADYGNKALKKICHVQPAQ